MIYTFKATHVDKKYKDRYKKKIIIITLNLKTVKSKHLYIVIICNFNNCR